jgi:AbrB family looped-hinge helix DNA binding protein
VATKVSDEAIFVTKKGQVTIPIRFRKSLNIGEGSKLLISLGDDSIVLRPLVELEDLAGNQAGKMDFSQALLELDALRKQDRY